MNQHCFGLFKICISSFILFIGCSSYERTPVSRAYHDLTAYYNAYYIAKEEIKKIEDDIFTTYQWNYNDILPIFPPFDSTKAAALKTQIENCIQKASLSVQRHTGSKWEDDSYILVGKSRYYALEFEYAIETFKYVNTHSKDEEAQHQALAELIRVFTDIGEYKNANAVIEYLQKMVLSKKNTKNVYLNAAYLYQKTENIEKMAESLAKIRKYVKSADKGRINFIIGQAYQYLGEEDKSRFFYKKVLKHRPSYELEFYTKLYFSQISKLSKTKDINKVEKFFLKLAKDTKNKEYKDKIYYELGNFYAKNGELSKAVESYKASIQGSSKNKRQKAYSYLNLGKIYYDSLKDFALAKNYYDSTISILPKDEENYEKIKKRQEILGDFVKHFFKIQENDSLLYLASLPKDSIYNLAKNRILKDKEKEKEKEKREKKRLSKKIVEEKQSLIEVTSNSKWYFSNPNTISQGYSEFKKIWGERKLEDNWRRSGKNPNILSEDNNIESVVEEENEEKQSEDIEKEIAEFIKNIPQSEESKVKLLQEIETALYELGKIYKLHLFEIENAITTYNDLLTRFPNSKYEPEVLYQLYLIYHKKGDDRQAMLMETQLKEKYPNSIFSKLIDNPNYREEDFATTTMLKNFYKIIYEHYEQKMYQRVVVLADSMLKIHPKNDFSDNIDFLKVLSTGQEHTVHKFIFELENFIKKYPESDLEEYVNKLMANANDFQKNKYNSAKVIFKTNFQQKHIFVISYNIQSKEMVEKLPPLVEDFLKNNDYFTLSVNNLILDDKNTLLLVSSFPGKNTSINFMKAIKDNILLEDQVKETEIQTFVISEENFDIVYNTKALSTYLDFFKKNY